ncbi:MAG TPA: toll/interleukin-1 receptor domain-containing protein [Verrucomicrobiae bacterium]
MAFFTENELRGYARDQRFRTFAHVKEAREQATVSIFLSHSHKDKDLVLGLIAYFEKLGIKIYVDWNDKEMPRVTNRETADKIKQKIAENNAFMVLATPNAIESKWVPWEVGIADQVKGELKVVVIPVADSSGRYVGAEYLQLYQRVEEAQSGGYGVFRPEGKGHLMDFYLKMVGFMGSS